jgi:prepilin-type N-terminal cleavage/methylation domain-containing protein
MNNKGIRRSGFTLVEMLVVVAVIGVLAGLLFPAIRNAQAKGRQTFCTNNLHQFSLGLTRYKHDLDGELPDWLSNLYPYYIDSKTVYLCKSDRSIGQEGSKPGSLQEVGDMNDFPETNDNNGNTTYTNRNTEITACSYLYEFCGADCGWWSGYIGKQGQATSAQVDANKNGKVSWQEAKEYQLNNGDKSHDRPYAPIDFPIIRCYHHHLEKKIDAFEYDENGNQTGTTKSGITMNVAYAGNIFMAPLKWEAKILH